MLPKVAIIYLTYNGKDSYRDITRCLTSIATLDYPMDRFEVICVENPSAHGTSWSFIEKEWLPRVGKDFPQLTIEKNENDLGYSGANNVGAKIAKEHGCDYVFALNQDADVDRGFLRAAVERAEADPKIAFVQSLIVLGEERDRINSFGNRFHYLGFAYCGGHRMLRTEAEVWLEKERLKNPDLEVPFFSGCAMLCRMSFVEKYGLFDTPFYMYHEDVDATFNARIHGFKTVIEPKSVVYHYYEFSRSIKKFYWMERNRHLVNLTYYKLGTLLVLLPAFIGVELISLAFALKSGWWREKLRSWAFYFKASTWQWVWRRRSRVMRERVIGDREFLKWAESRILFQEADPASSGKGIADDARGGIVTRIANPLMTIYWKVAYFLIRW